MTGAASSIGPACAQRLARASAVVAVLDVNGDAAKDVAEKIGGEALQADLSDYEVLDSLRVEADVVVHDTGL
ncbi:MAG: SDR family oxidoreductase [Rubrobacter sp.]|nr:SDR family oxidoreductase [Rubrobacter sp.]